MQYPALFNKAAAAGLLATTLLTGCGCESSAPVAPEEKARAEALDKQGIAVVAEECRVIDKNKDHPKRAREWDTYDYNFGIVIIDSRVTGNTNESSLGIAMGTLAEPKKDRAIELFKYLPPSAGCKAPKL